MTDMMLRDDIGDDGFSELTEKITRESDFRCTSYKDKCVRRRIAVRMRARGARTYAQYAALLDDDIDEYARLLDALTVNVTKFFRDPAMYATLAREVIPTLWSSGGPIDVWSAGCASGEEPYSLATLFYEHAGSLGELRQVGRVSVIGSDIDRASLEAAGRAMYLPGSFADTAQERMERYFPPLEGIRTVIPPIRAMTRFERLDLLRDRPPAAAFDLIACRNVVIYFDRVSQESLLDVLFDSLRPGGYLVMGHVETISGRARKHLLPVDVRKRIYRKPQ